MGTVFSHNWSQKQSCDNFEGVFSFVQPQSEGVSADSHFRGQNKDLPQHTVDKAAVYFSGWIGTEEGQGGFFSQ